MSSVMIIAEAGVNHNGQVPLALRLVDAAADAGADAVKFQTFRAENVVAGDAPKASYQAAATGTSESQLEMLKKLELTADGHRLILERCRERGVAFLSTPFDDASAHLLHELGMRTYKIPSGEVTNVAFLRIVGKLASKAILSTGMATMAEVEVAVEALRSAGLADIVLLHCVTEYPAPIDQVNLRAMVSMRERFRLPTGYSDHTLGIEACLAAVALGASVLEKHFTLDRTLPGPDHAASMEPKEFREFVRSVRSVEAALGDGLKRPAPCELRNLPVVRRSLFARCAIAEGTRITAEMLDCKRPGTGISAADIDRVVGRRATRAFAAGAMLSWNGIDE